MSLPWRTRLDYRLLKLQARFEGLAFDRAAPWLLSVAFWLALTRSGAWPRRSITVNAPVLARRYQCRC